MPPIPERRAVTADVVVIGLGSGGEQVAKDLAAEGRTVYGFEPGRVGGECPYVACIPSKSLLHDARLGQRSWSDAVARRDELAHHLDDTEHAEGVVDAGVHLVRSAARLADERTVAGDDIEVTADHVVIATGASPVVPDVPGIDAKGVWTSADALTSDVRPERLVIVGGGPIGSELGQVYARYGSDVVLCDMADRLHPDTEPEIADMLVDTLESAGVTVRLGIELTEVVATSNELTVAFDDGSSETADRVLLAVGTKPRIDDIGLDTVIDGAFSVDKGGQVNDLDWLWAVGDVTGHSHWTHGATYQARHLVAELMGRAWNEPVTIMPDAVFTDPPVGRVGQPAEACRADGHDVVVGWASYDELPRAATDEVERGRFALVVDRPSGRILGASAHGARADDLIQIATAWMTAGVPIRTAARTVFPFPTYSQVVELAMADALSKL